MMISFEPNIDAKGRIARAAVAFVVFDVALAGFLLLDWPLWICIPLFLFSFFVGYEALRGWCFARACGIKTPL